MKALMKTHRGPGAMFADVAVPTIQPDEVLVRVKAASICGTDLHIYDWDEWAQRTVHTPIVFGHEFAGVVECVGEDVKHVKAGDHVSAEGHMVCGVCRACRTGNAHVCPNTRSFGITANGCFAEFAVVKASNVIKNDPSVPHEIACLQDPLGNAVHTVLSGPVVGRTVAVVGVGAIGLMAVAVARACGAGTIIAVDVNEYRLEMAKRFGADVCVNSAQTPMEEAIREATDGLGAEAVLEMSGHPDAIRGAFASAANAGRVAMLGIPTKDIPVDFAKDIIFKGLTVHGITGRRMYETWEQMKGLLGSGRVDLSQLVTHRFRLERFEEAFELVRSGRCGKVVFTVGE
ncbi:L-threonine 3-dehydrogenase [Paenibacillus thermotolerans]|uniref:L-threonine 3-dehydrogenase n=1 Tax=Paenibacillus thermotolerans TaxID=3027807 RepID=UPI002368A70D|nr:MULTISPECIES: L-threonine 3-dehydrogenase [unclassified Paenibacillus]